MEPISAADLDAAIHPAVGEWFVIIIFSRWLLIFFMFYHQCSDELQKTLSTTIEMLGYVHKMTTGDLASGEIPSALKDYLSGSVNARDN